MRYMTYPQVLEYNIHSSKLLGEHFAISLYNIRMRLGTSLQSCTTYEYTCQLGTMFTIQSKLSNCAKFCGISPTSIYIEKIYDQTSNESPFNRQTNNRFTNSTTNSHPRFLSVPCDICIYISPRVNFASTIINMHLYAHQNDQFPSTTPLILPFGKIKK